MKHQSLATLFFGVLATSVFPTAFATPFLGELISPSHMHSMMTKGKRYTLEAGFEYLHPIFGKFSGIVVENPSTSSSSSTRSADLENDYPDSFAQVLKFQMIVNEEKRWAVSVKSFLPLNSLAQLDTGYIYLPEYVLYRAEAQRPRLQLGTGLNLSDRVRVGLGLDVGFSVSTTANVFLQNGAGRYSDQRLSAKLKPTIVPQASIEWDQYQFVMRMENKSPFILDTNAGARVFSGGAGVDFQYRSESAAFFDPWSFELHGKNELTSGLYLNWGLAYQLWSRYPARAAVIPTDIQNNCNGNGGCSSVFSRTLSPDFKARNLFVPQVGIEKAFGDQRYEVGYRFKDSIFAGVPTGVGNYLDPPRHDFWLGATFPMTNGWEWAANLQVSRLTEQSVVKSDPTEIGGPYYAASGWLLGGGARLVIPF